VRAGLGVARQRKAIVDGLKESVVEFNDGVAGTGSGQILSTRIDSNWRWSPDSERTTARYEQWPLAKPKTLNMSWKKNHIGLRPGVLEWRRLVLIENYNNA
jgi:hypothetical protein